MGNGLFLLDMFPHIQLELLFMKSHQDCVFCKFFPCKLSYIFFLKDKTDMKRSNFQIMITYQLF